MTSNSRAGMGALAASFPFPCLFLVFRVPRAILRMLVDGLDWAVMEVSPCPQMRRMQTLFPRGLNGLSACRYHCSVASYFQIEHRELGLPWTPQFNRNPLTLLYKADRWGRREPGRFLTTFTLLELFNRFLFSVTVSFNGPIRSLNRRLVLPLFPALETRLILDHQQSRGCPVHHVDVYPQVLQRSDVCLMHSTILHDNV
jgi:hypothetical protein